MRPKYYAFYSIQEVKDDKKTEKKQEEDNQQEEQQETQGEGDPAEPAGNNYIHTTQSGNCAKE